MYLMATVNEFKCVSYRCWWWKMRNSMDSSNSAAGCWIRLDQKPSEKNIFHPFSLSMLKIVRVFSFVFSWFCCCFRCPHLGISISMRSPANVHLILKHFTCNCCTLYMIRCAFSLLCTIHRIVGCPCVYLHKEKILDFLRVAKHQMLMYNICTSYRGQDRESNWKISVIECVCSLGSDTWNTKWAACR